MRYFIPAALLIAADQLIKYWTRITLLPGESIHVIGNFFKITRINNGGAAFGMLSGQGLFLIVIPIAVIIAASWYLAAHRQNHWTCRIALLMIIAGGIGNLIDRLAFGQVTDMFSFSIFPPVFNLADVSVTVGCALLVFYVLFDETLKKKRS